jgi:hypothetical protein
VPHPAPAGQVARYGDVALEADVAAKRILGIDLATRRTALADELVAELGCSGLQHLFLHVFFTLTGERGHIFLMLLGGTLAAGCQRQHQGRRQCTGPDA